MYYVRAWSRGRGVSDIVWEDPPAGWRPRWVAEFVKELREHPGKWAVVQSPTRSDDVINSSTVTRLRHAGCEVRTSTLDSDRQPMIRGTLRAWARWPEVAP